MAMPKTQNPSLAELLYLTSGRVSKSWTLNSNRLQAAQKNSSSIQIGLGRCPYGAVPCVDHNNLRPDMLTAFIESFFILVFVQPDDEIFELAFNKFVSRQLEDNVNNEVLDFKDFHDLIVELRATLFDKRIISQTVLSAPPDPTGQTATAGHTASLSGFMSDGRKIVVNVVAVGTVVIRADGSAQLREEKLVFSTGPAVVVAA